MKPKIYLETSIVSYLTANPSKDVIVSANQFLVHEWWNDKREDFDLFVSELVIDEAGKGNKSMAAKRLDLMADLPLLQNNDDTKKLAAEILNRGILPKKATLDVFHISISAVHGIDFLLTLNCKHIANAFIYRRIGQVCKDFGFQPPVVCTPLEILGKEYKIDEG